ncbi:MAG TPA: hypothetical protein VGV64_01490, partial [Thermoplasmata archaeon]|nr:hypothetical protein [Thermoplasmata archaeon]
ERDCEFLLVSGDLFHTAVPDPAEVAPIAGALKRLIDHGRRVYVIYGSHDYVAHRTSWLDVLAETGIFLRAAPEAIREEGGRWTLPFVVDAPTGVRIAGISGRAHGLDRSYFLGVDSERFRAEPGFKVFMFHSAIEEYLPEGLREHLRGISRDDLPTGCDYYAGGHIHRSYVGTGPNGLGLLINPGAVFGTSTTDIESRANRLTHSGVVIVTVREGRPEAEFVETAPPDVEVFDIDLSGETVEEARVHLERAVKARAGPRRLLFPRVHGTLSDGSIGTLGLRRPGEAADFESTGSVHWDVTDLSPIAADPVPSSGGAERLEIDAVAALAASVPPTFPTASPTQAVLRELLQELGREPSEGESKADYDAQRSEAARRILGVPPARTG